MQPEIKIESELITNYEKIQGTNQIRIYGTIEEIVEGDPVTIAIKNEFSEIIFLAQTIPDNSGEFSYEILIEGPLWENSTSFTIQATYGIPTMEREPGVPYTRTG